VSSQSIAGYNGVAYVSTDGGSTYHAYAELQDVKLKIDNKMLDATSHSSAGFSEYKYGNQTWTATIGSLAVFGDAGQAAVMAAIINKTQLKFRFDPAGTGSGLPRREGFGLLQTVEEAQPNADLDTEALTIQGTGALVISTQ
jgi:hypothetical protein